MKIKRQLTENIIADILTYVFESGSLGTLVDLEPGIRESADNPAQQRIEKVLNAFAHLGILSGIQQVKIFPAPIDNSPDEFKEFYKELEAILDE